MGSDTLEIRLHHDAVESEIIQKKAMTENILKIKINAGNVLLKKRLEDIISSSTGFVVQQVMEENRTDLFIQDLSDDFEKDFCYIESLLSTHSVDEVFVTSSYVGSDLLLKAMRSGAREFLIQPINEQEVTEALERFKRRRYSYNKAGPQDSLKSGRVINVLGCKGGVGTTTVAVNLAVSMEKMLNKQSIVMLDMNKLWGEIPLFLGLKASHHWGAVTNNIDRLDDMFLTKVLSKHNLGIQILPSPGHLNGDKPITPEIIERIINLMKKMFDIIIIDSGQSLNETSLKTLSLSDEILMVTLLNLPCLNNTNKLLRSFSGLSQAHMNKMKIVINRYLKKSGISLQDAENAFSKKVFWTIPNDYKTTSSAIDQGKALTEVAYKAPVTKSLQGLADALIKGKESQNR